VNLLLFTDADRLDSNKITVRDRRLQHLLQVHKASPGDTLRIGEVNGLMGEAAILQIDTEAAVLAFELSLPPPPKLPLSLVLALPRPKMLRRILRSAAELGVAELHLINSYRVEKSYWQSPVLERATVREYLLQGLEQSRDTCLPVVHCHQRFKPFVEDSLPGLLAGTHALLAHPGEHPPCPRNIDEKCLLVIGPEGGFIPYEVEQLQRAGCQAVSVGARILRVENAVSSIIGRLF
jgi:RsmE family RNA methyltransferase